MIEMLQEAINAVERLNSLSDPLDGMHCLWVSYEPLTGTIEVAWHGEVLWCSEDDEREPIGRCERCKGRCLERELGITTAPLITCTACGGTGKGEPREPIYVFLVRELRRSAQDTLRSLEGE